MNVTESEDQAQRLIFDWARWQQGKYPQLEAMYHVRESVQRGDVDGSSFGFVCLEDKWSKVQHEGEEMYKRSIVKAELIEVSPCTFPAYDSSQINCRSFERMKADTKEEKRLEELRKEARLLEIADENNKE